MTAVQLMTGRGGWPLIALPSPMTDQCIEEPFSKDQWINILLNLSDLFIHEKEKMLNYAKQLTEGVKLAELVKMNTKEKLGNKSIYLSRDPLNT